MDSLFGGAASGQVAAQNPQDNQWGLTPSDEGSGSRRKAEEVSGSGTIWSWLIAISPILAAGAIVYVMLTLKPAFTDWPFEVAVVAPYLLVLLFAVADRSALRQLGHSRPRSPFWALLSAPIYLIARAGETRREDGSGTALTIAWFVSVVVAIGGIVGYGLLTHHALFVGLPA
jgi:peptidoglycan/LPS O-acetylase OafA/YrhL